MLLVPSLFSINRELTLGGVHFASQEQSAPFIKVSAEYAYAADSVTFSRRGNIVSASAAGARGMKPISSRVFLDHSRHYPNWCPAIFLPGPFGRFCPVCMAYTLTQRRQDARRHMYHTSSSSSTHPLTHSASPPTLSRFILPYQFRYTDVPSCLPLVWPCLRVRVSSGAQ